MSIRISWYNRTKTVILWERFDRSSWEEFHNTQDQLFKMLDTVSHKVDVISVSYDPMFPANAIPNLKRVIDRVHPNEGYKVLVNTSGFIRHLFEIVGKLNYKKSRQWYFTDTIEEAEALLAKLRNHPMEGGV